MQKNRVYFIVSLLVFSCVSHQALARRYYQAIDSSCQLPNKEDSYKLAVSWQPAFCESHRGKP